MALLTAKHPRENLEPLALLEQFVTERLLLMLLPIPIRRLPDSGESFDEKLEASQNGLFCYRQNYTIKPYDEAFHVSLHRLFGDIRVLEIHPHCLGRAGCFSSCVIQKRDISSVDTAPRTTAVESANVTSVKKERTLESKFLSDVENVSL
ncbi:hypothetical protein L596_028541 [Steinernema carpocapsae]|uniref:Uncharacterized protein n=1 Tax=Steinernema carpocapsae TaxID=34508 RepID=A0A4V5ZY54_STECR|nr:hypothetical protein L596_028541 [Steinernema carpocapsae]